MRFKESDFRMKLKKIKAEQVISVIAVLIVLTLAVVLTITAVNNRSKKNDLPLPDEGQKAPTTDKVPDVTKPDTQKTPDKQENTDAQPTVKEELPPTLALPVSGTLSKGHSVDVQVFSKTMNEYRTHLGIDIGTAEGADVRAAADGVVSQIWEDPMMGNCVAISHAGECVTVYKNLAATLAEGIAVGEEVKAGQLLGNVGDSAMMELAEEAHLHLEVTVKGLQVDPMECFSKSVSELLTSDNAYEDDAAGADPDKAPAAK